MVDIHSHVLPGLDDGPYTMEESVEMVRQAFEDGVTHIVATPHAFCGTPVVDIELRDTKIEELKKKLMRSA